MAVSTQESQQNIQLLKNAGLTSDQITGYGDKLNPGEAKAILSKYGIDPNQVLSASNIASTISSPAAAPDDLLGIRSSIYNEQGVNTSQQAYLDAQKAYNTAMDTYNTEQQQLGNRAVSMSKVIGTQRQHTLTNQNNITNLLNAQNLALQDYQFKKSNADEMFNIRNQEISEKKQLMTQYPDAGIKLTDSFEKSLSKISDYQKDQEKKAYKDELKKQLQSMGKSTKGLSTNELEKKLQKANKAALEAAKYESDLKLEQLRLDIENTKSLIANRGKETPKEIKWDDNTIRQAITEGISQGASWEEIATRLEMAGVDTSPGSLADKQLRWKFLDEWTDDSKKSNSSSNREL